MQAEIKKLTEARLADMPKLPKAEGQAAMITSVQLNGFQVAVSMFLQPLSLTMASGVREIIGNPEVELPGIWYALSPGERILDNRCAGKLFTDAPKCIQNLLLDDAKREAPNGQDSLLVCIRSIAKRVNFRSDKRTVMLLTKFLKSGGKNQVTEPARLCAELLEFKNEFGVYSKLASVECDVLYKAAVDHLISRLCERADMNRPLVSRLAKVECDHPGDMGRYMDTLEAAAQDLTLFHQESRGKPTQPGNGTYAVDKSDMICMNRREGRPCRDALKCPYKHENISAISIHTI